MIKPDPQLPIRVVGLGCQRGCSAIALRELVEQSLHSCGLSIGDVNALASIDLKCDEPGLLELALQLGLPLRFFSAAQLVAYEPRLTHRSGFTFKHTGCYGVAESAALALASHYGEATLLITRRKSQRATFALAFAPPINR